MARKKNYLNNKDILKQIHLSKITYCVFKDPINDNQQDFIVPTTEDIFGTQNVQRGKDEEGEPIFEDVPVIQLAHEARATRLNKLNETTLTPEDIALEDIVFRVLTSEHIPLVPKKKTKKKAVPKKDIISELFDEFDDEIIKDSPEHTAAVLEDVEMVPMRCGFPPFFHYRLINNELKIVGKSHWEGTLDDGHFKMGHGRTTDELAKMFMKLCERYATRSNWRGYTYNDEMQGQALVQLAHTGLQFNEYKSQNPFAYYTQIITNSFTRVLNIEKKMQTIRDDILEENGLTPSWTRQFANQNQPKPDAKTAK